LYGQPDYADLATAYVFGLSSNHAFVDGNKRVAFLALGLFLGLNGYKLTASQVDATLTMMSVAKGEIQESEFGQWIRAHTIQRH
jgi:death-on-curing protein